MKITLQIKCPTCLSNNIKRNGIKVDGKQNHQCKDCKRQFIGDHALSYQGCNSGITGKILHLMIRGSGVRDIAEVERISIGKVLRTLSESIRFSLNKATTNVLKSMNFGLLQGIRKINNGLFMPTIENLEKLLLMFGVSGIQQRFNVLKLDLKSLGFNMLELRVIIGIVLLQHFNVASK